MYKMSCRITIGDITPFYRVSTVEINSSWKNLTDTCTIILPKKTIVKGTTKQLTEIAGRGTPVKVELGYNDEFYTEFEGYVAYPHADIPTKLICEDKMFLLKDNNHVKSWSKVTLPQLVKEIIPASIPVKVSEMELGAYRINNLSSAQVLKDIREHFGIVAYFRKGTLHVGFPHDFSLTTKEPFKYSFQHNIIEAGSLEYKMDEEAKICVKAVSILKSNKKIEVEVGDKDGNKEMLHFFNITNKEDLKKAAESQLKLMKAKGYRGSFKSFGFPLVEHGHELQIIDKYYPEREGIYIVDKVVKTFDTGGYRRLIELGYKTIDKSVQNVA